MTKDGDGKNLLEKEFVAKVMRKRIMILTILELYRRYKTKPMYYIISEFILNKDQFWKTSLHGKEIWIVHPDSFAAFKRICGKVEKFEVTREMILSAIGELLADNATKLWQEREKTGQQIAKSGEKQKDDAIKQLIQLTDLCHLPRCQSEE